MHRKRKAFETKKDGRKMTNRLLILSIFAAMSTATTHAQVVSKLKVNVPFSFHVGQTAMPAGAYVVRHNPASPSFLTIQSETTNAAVTFGTFANSALQPVVEGKLVFHRYSGGYILSQVWTPGSMTTATLFKSRLEQEMARNEGAAEQVVVAKAR
jgi:hypothetical protein